MIFDVVGYSRTPTAAGQSIPPPDAESVVRHRGSGTPIGATESMSFDVLGKGGVPGGGVTAVVMNVTVTEPTWDGYLTVYPGRCRRPTDGIEPQLCRRPDRAEPRDGEGAGLWRHQVLQPSGLVAVVADVVGYYDGDRSTEAGRFFPIDPTRLIEHA